MLVLLLTLVAGFVRSAGVDHMLPHGPEPDGLVYDKQVRVLEAGEPGTSAQHLYFFYPLLPSMLAAAFTDAPAADDIERPLAEQLERAKAHRVRIRLVVAWLSALATPFVWLLARRFLAARLAFLAAALYAFDPFVLWFAQQARPHGVLVLWTAAALWTSTLLARRAGWRECLACAAAAAGGVATLQSGAALLVPMAAALVLALRPLPWRERALGFARACCGLALVATAAWAAYPAQESKPAPVELGARTLELSGHKMDLTLFNGAGFAKVWNALLSYDPLLLGATLAGLALLAAMAVPRLRATAKSVLEPGAGRDLVVAASFVLAYLLAVGLYQRTYQRFALPLVPPLCVLAAFGLGVLARWRKALVVAAALVVVGQIGLTVGTVRARVADDTLELAARWIEERVPADEPVAFMPTLDLPLWMDDASVARNEAAMLDEAFVWFSWRWGARGPQGAGRRMIAMPLRTQAERDAARLNPAGFVKNLGARWVVVEDQRGRRPLLTLLREEVAARADLAVRISPYGESDEGLPLLQQDDDYPRTLPWTWLAARHGRVGPSIEIYRLRE